MKHEVFWKNPGYKVRPELKEDIECDYLIVGGGIAGVSAAYFLAKAGEKKVVLAEKHFIGSGATGKAAGTLVTRGEVDLGDLIKDHGRERAVVMWKKIHKALDDMEKVIKEEKIECEAEPQDTMMCGFKGRNQNNLYVEYEAEKSVEGTTRLLEGDELKKEINTELFDRGVLSEMHALSVNPLKCVQGFSQAVERYGVKVYENTAVLEAKDNIAKTQYGNIRYKKIIWAIDIDYPEDHIKNLKTTLIVTRPLSHEELDRIGFLKKKKVVWDSRKNYNYFKVTHDNRLLIGFGNLFVHKKHKKTDPHLSHLKQLENFIKKIFPYLDAEIEYAWSGHFAVNKQYSQGPLVKIEGDKAVITGCGTQVGCFISAEHVVNKLLGKSDPDSYF